MAMGSISAMLSKRTAALLMKLFSAEKILKRNHKEMVIGFATLVENKDGSTGGHIKRTSTYVKLLAEELKKRGYVRNDAGDFDNVAYPLHLHYKLDKKTIAEKVEQALRGASLWDEVKDKLHSSGLALSGGQQQRLCIARTIASEPEILLMDEPTSAIDPVATLKIEELMDSLRERFTIVIVTHNMQQAARISDQTVFFYKGRIVEYGETKDIFTNPKNKQTEEYITGRFS